MAFQIAQDPAADAVLTESPFALLLGMLLDQQYKMETPSRAATSCSPVSATSTHSGSPRWTPRSSGRSRPRPRRSTASRPRWRRRCRRSPGSSRSSTTATPPGSGPRPAVAPTCSSGCRHSRLRQAEGADLRRAPRQAGRCPARRLGEDRGCLRRGWVPVGRGRGRRRLAAEGAGLQAGRQGEQARGRRRARNERVAWWRRRPRR